MSVGATLNHTRFRLVSRVFMVVGLVALTTPGCGSNSGGESSAATPVLPAPPPDVPLPPPPSGPPGFALRLSIQSEPPVVFELGSYPVDMITRDELVFGTAAGNVTDPILYDHVRDNFNFDGLYAARDGSEEYFFRFGWQRFDGERTHFYYVKWANDRVPPSPKVYAFSCVDADIGQDGDASLATVGDSITWWGQGQTLRARLDLLIPRLVFVGSRTDTLGYGHEGEGGDDTTELLARLDGIAPASQYTVLIGTNDRLPLTPSDTVRNIRDAAAALLSRRETKHVHVLTLLPRTDSYDERNQQVNALLREWIAGTADPRLHLLDTERVFRDVADWPSLFPDGVHPSGNGFALLAASLATHLGRFLP